MKKSAKVLTAFLCDALGATALAACNNGKGGGIPDGMVRVTFQDGSREISHTDIDKGSKVTKPETDPTKDGYEFVRWYATPSYNIAFDFDEEIEENTSVFAGFRSTAADTHTWYLAGTSKSGIFKESGDWKDGFTPENVPAAIKMEKSADKGNVYTFTSDFFKGDQFQILNTDEGWAGQVGYGYMNPDQYSTEDTSPIYGKSSPYDDNAKKQNLTVGVSGNYTVTLIVDANEHKLTEISYVRNGDVDDTNVTYEYYILGEKLNEWNTANYEFTHFATEDHINYELTIGMQDGDMFQFNSYDSNESQLRWNPENCKLADDADTQAAISNIADKNFGVKGGTGTYKYTLKLGKDADNEDLLEVSAKKISDTLPEYQFYVKGNIGGDTSWEEKHEMTKGTDGKYSVTLDIAAGEEFMLVAADKDDIAKSVFDITNAYAYKRLVSKSIEYKNNNYSAKVADKFTITIDPATMFVTIDGEKDAPRVYCIGAKGTMNKWNVKDATEDQKGVIDGTTLTATLNMTLAAGDEFMFITYEQGDETYAQVSYINAGRVTDLPDGLSGTQNFKCEVAGTYAFTVTIDAIGNITGMTVAKAA